MARRASSRAQQAARAASAHLERVTTWNGLKQGDPVVVSGLVQNGLTWEFRAHVRNTHNGDESIEVIGGRPGERMVRAFAPDRIFPATARRRPRDGGRVEGPSLAQAPQLMLDL